MRHCVAYGYVDLKTELGNVWKNKPLSLKPEFILEEVTMSPKELEVYLLDT